MNNPPKINDDVNRELSLILDELKEKGRFIGIILANRNGEIINENIGKDTDGKTLTSMCASVFESAGGLGDTTGNQKIVKIIAELEKSSILMVEIKEKKVFLIIIINNQVDSSFIFDNMEDYMQKINSLI